MIKVKICGLTNENDIRYVNSHLPDYAGFVFAKSKRRLNMPDAKELIRKLRTNIKKVGIFVNHDIEELRNIVNECQLDVVQLHGDEDNDYIGKLSKYYGNNVQIWKALKMKTNDNISNIQYKYISTFILDTYSESTYGGTGKKFDWEIALKLKDIGNIVLAGGLNPDNVKQAVDFVKPYAVDVSSGVENEYGKKDEDKIKNFIYSVKYNLY